MRNLQDYPLIATSDFTQVCQFTCFQNNYGVLLYNRKSETAVAFDVPEAGPYLEALKVTGWKLTYILLTHHHHDHIGGVNELVAQTGAKVVGHARSAQKLGFVDLALESGDCIDLNGLEAKAIGTPGHTLDSISWWVPDANMVHTGDALFSLGCGRLFEGDGEMLWASLNQLKREIPAETLVFCGHEYTEANGRFALSVDSKNQTLLKRQQDVLKLRANDKPTLPSTMAQELATNPFLRVDQLDIRQSLDLVDASDADVFSKLRQMKDNF
ncbi:hydroxyacylglutathione hydrolase [Polycladidibacter stylochi]|uniref:hydroxyacylglutathione hydrolase n=1 Tax=Polycladidibacter stylochi TaxID=1807766 RepID=UPI000830032E|nr:hydroxyacylglutathione hydrolase [Pseudovibrio stylochi]